MDAALQPQFRIRRVSESGERIFTGLIAGIDAPPEPEQQHPFWEIHDLDDLDHAMAGNVAKLTHAQAALAEWQTEVRALQARQGKLLAGYSHLVPTPEAGKAWRATPGAFSMGSYRCQPERLPELKVTDIQQCAEAGICVSKPVLDTKLAREYIIDHGEAPAGLLVIPQMAVTYSPPKRTAEQGQVIAGADDAS